MFPPKQTDQAEVWIGGLWQSLQRAGDFIQDEATLEKTEKSIRACLRFGVTPSRAARNALRGYVKMYASESGWKIRSLSVTERYIEFVASRD